MSTYLSYYTLDWSQDLNGIKSKTPTRLIQSPLWSPYRLRSEEREKKHHLRLCWSSVLQCYISFRQQVYEKKNSTPDRAASCGISVPFFPFHLPRTSFQIANDISLKTISFTVKSPSVTSDCCLESTRRTRVTWCMALCGIAVFKRSLVMEWFINK